MTPNSKFPVRHGTVSRFPGRNKKNCFSSSLFSGNTDFYLWQCEEIYGDVVSPLIFGPRSNYYGSKYGKPWRIPKRKKSLFLFSIFFQMVCGETVKSSAQKWGEKRVWEVFPDDDPPRKKIPKRAPTFLIHRSLTAIYPSRNIGRNRSPFSEQNSYPTFPPHISFCGSLLRLGKTSKKEEIHTSRYVDNISPAFFQLVSPTPYSGSLSHENMCAGESSAFSIFFILFSSSLFVPNWGAWRRAMTTAAERSRLTSHS